MEQREDGVRLDDEIVFVPYVPRPTLLEQSEVSEGSAEMSSVSTRKITVYTDGAAKGNPGPAGWCWWISEKSWAAGGWPSATNNAGELKAVAEALTALVGIEAEVCIVTDSMYVHESLNKYVHAYRRNGWKTSKGAEVANKELIELIDEMIRARGGVQWQWQRGHTGAHGNTQADEGASNAAEAFRDRRALPSGPGYNEE